MIHTFISTLRTSTYYVLISIWSIIWGGISLSITPFLPERKKHFFTAVIWSTVAIWFCKLSCGVKWRVVGKENIPEQACVVASNHQSSLETYFLQIIFSPQSIVFKKEVLKIPIIGRLISMLHPIPIDRNNKKGAMNLILTMGTDFLKKNIWLVIFPEGTRNPWPTVGKFSKGATMLACKAEKDILPVFHNSGIVSLHNNSWVKQPGLITVTIGKPIKTKDKSIHQIHQELIEWMHNTLKSYQ